MPMSTIELPKDMVESAERYAVSTHSDLVHLFAFALRKTYGIESVYVVSETPRKGKTYGDMLEESPDGGIAPVIRSLMNTARKESVSAGKSYDDIKWDHFKDKYDL